MIKIGIIGIGLILLMGCAAKPVIENRAEHLIYVTTPLSLPEKPVLPKWTGKDMSCLSEEMKQKVRDRDKMRKEYGEQLEVIIKSTQK